MEEIEDENKVEMTSTDVEAAEGVNRSATSVTEMEDEGTDSEDTPLLQQDDRETWTYQPRQSVVETIVESDEEINYTYTVSPATEVESKRDDLIYFYGCTEVLAPKRRIRQKQPNDQDTEGNEPKTRRARTLSRLSRFRTNSLLSRRRTRSRLSVSEPSEFEFYHEKVDISCLADKIVLIYISSRKHPRESQRGKELKQLIRQFVLDETDFSLDLEGNIGSGDTKLNDVVVLYLSRDSDEAGFASFMRDQPFYAIPFEKSLTRSTLLRQMTYDSSFSSRTSRLIVVNGNCEVLTNWGKSCLLYNRENCLKEWRKGNLGINLGQFLFSKYWSK